MMSVRLSRVYHLSLFQENHKWYPFQISYTCTQWFISPLKWGCVWWPCLATQLYHLLVCVFFWDQGSNNWIGWWFSGFLTYTVDGRTIKPESVFYHEEEKTVVQELKYEPVCEKWENATLPERKYGKSNWPVSITRTIYFCQVILWQAWLISRFTKPCK